MTLLGRESLLKKESLEVIKVDLGEKEFVYVREMTGRERDRFEQLLIKKIKKGNKIDFEQTLDDFRAKLVVSTVCNKEGERLLTTADFPALSENMGAVKLMKIADAAGKLNGISEEDKEEMTKNLEGGPDEDSSSASVKN